MSRRGSGRWAGLRCSTADHAGAQFPHPRPVHLLAGPQHAAINCWLQERRDTSRDDPSSRVHYIMRRIKSKPELH
jgi:hypothetical protein